MKKLSGFEKAALALTAAVILFSAGYFTADRKASAQAWGVETQRVPSASRPVPDRSREGDTPPATLLEGERIDINSASRADLQRLPGIGEARAQAIVDYRTEHGPFSSEEELMLVSGIGQGIFDGLKDYITVG